MDVLYKQKSTNEESKLEIAASLEASYKSAVLDIGMKISA